MNPMPYMVAALMGQRAQASRTPALHEPVPGSPMSKTDRIRAYLREVGPATAVVLATEADLDTTGLVGALLKNDIRRGAVVRRGDRYFWVHEFDDRLATALGEAAALLRRHGWRVKRP